MINEQEKLERFEKAVNQQIDSQIKELIQQAESSRDEILQKANDASLYVAYDRIKEEIKVISNKYVRLVSKAELECKRDVLVCRDKLVCKVFENIKASLIDYTKTPEYKDYLVNTIKEEIQKYQDSDDMIFYLSKSDFEISDDIKKQLEKDLFFQKKDSIKIGGVCIGFKNRNVLIDKTLDSALDEQKNEFNNSECLRLN